jgi:hypothetical protein
MARRWWLPYGAWALLVGAGLLVTQSGFGYCAELHPRMCANALLADLSSGWDPDARTARSPWWCCSPSVGRSSVAWRVLGRTTGVALAAWAVVVGVGMVFYGGHVQMCLGPLNVTPESCRIALGLPPETDWDRFANGPAPLVAVLLTGWLAIVMAGALRRRQRGGL